MNTPTKSIEELTIENKWLRERMDTYEKNISELMKQLAEAIEMLNKIKKLGD